MKTTLLLKLVSVLLIGSIHAFDTKAQDAKFGKISNEELTMRTYEKDTSAVAVVLSDKGNTYFTYGGEGFEVIFQRHTRIKILKKAGYDEANFSLPYYHSLSKKEKVSNIKGYTYNLENGKVVKDKLTSKDIFDEKTNDYWHKKKITLPNVKEGSVIEIIYEVRSDMFYNLRDWEFQTTIPVAYSEYKVIVPEYFDYKLNQQGYLSFTESRQEKGRTNFFVKWGPGDPGVRGKREPSGSSRVEAETVIYFFTVKDAPALKTEKYITTLSDYQAKISFELQRTMFPGSPHKVMTGNWENVTKDLLEDENFGRQLKRRGQFKNEVAAECNTPEQRLEAIHTLVKNNVKWNGNHGIYARSNLSKVYENKSGSAAEINLLLIAMLLEAGFDAAPVLVSTRDHGRVNTNYSPMLNKFNYVVAHVRFDGKDLLLDATDPLVPVTMLPVRCLNGKGRLIKGEDQRWVDLNPTQFYSKLINIELSINEQGEMKGKGLETASGYNALYLRKAIKEDGEEKFAEQHAKESGDIKLGKPVIENVNDINAVLSITYDISISGNNQNNEIIYLNPLLGHGEKENPFKLTERMYPVDFAAPINETYVTKFKIPAGYVVDEMPESTAVSLPESGGRFTYMLQEFDNEIHVMSKVSISRPVFYADGYAYLKEFYNIIVAKHAEKIVLKKASTN